MSILKDYMVQILQSRGFSADERDGYIYGKREDVAVVVLTAGDMLIDDVQDFVKNVSGFSGRKIVVSLGRIDDNVHKYLQSNGIHYWGREEIEHEVGNLQLSVVTNSHGKSLIDEVISDELPQKLMEPPEQAIPVIVESAEERAERIVKPNFMLEDVKYLARHDIQGYKYELELVPHYLFHFVITDGKGNQKAGIAAVNGLTSHVETWRWGFELVDSIDLPNSKREPKIDFENAKQIAQDMISKEYKSHTETVKDFGHSEITERNRTKEEAINIEPKGLVYLPVWCVEGKNGAMIVNSSSGKIISEHIHGGAQATETKLG